MGNDKIPSPIDVHVGSRVRMRRNILGCSQEKLGSSLGITFQQIQKYERGANRIGSSRLYTISKILDVPVSYFFDNMPDEITDNICKKINDNEQSPTIDDMSSKETLNLLRNYYGIEDEEIRKSIFALVKSLNK